jgi:hypothetical protein
MQLAVDYNEKMNEYNHLAVNYDRLDDNYQKILADYKKQNKLTIREQSAYFVFFNFFLNFPQNIINIFNPFDWHKKSKSIRIFVINFGIFYYWS